MVLMPKCMQVCPSVRNRPSKKKIVHYCTEMESGVCCMITHIVIFVCILWELLVQYRVTIMANHPYSSDLAPAVSFLFLLIKGYIKGTSLLIYQISDCVWFSRFQKKYFLTHSSSFINDIIGVLRPTDVTL